MIEQGDVLHFQTNDGGDIEIERGRVTFSGGLETAAYLSMFGGNEDDGGRENSPHQYWGNLGEDEQSRQYRGETEALLRSLPAIPANLRRVEEAAKRDLAWFVSANVATAVAVTASLPGLNKVRIVVQIDQAATLEFIENWKADAA